MVETASGFLRPRQTGPLSDAEDAMIARICPGLGQTVAAAGRREDAIWGPYVAMHTGWATDPALRFAGASGGALSALVRHLIESGVVDAAVQTAPAPALAIGNATVVSTRAEEVLAAAGSRYAPSAPLAGLAALIADGRRFAFVGKPCDVAALRAIADANIEVANRFPVMLAFFCAGVPAHSGGRAVLAALGVSESEVAAFRYRGHGWPGRATARLHDGTERSMSYHDSWGGILTRHLQHRCKICADSTGQAADLVCADAWACDENGYPLFEEADGVSLIMARTALGAELLAAAEAAGQVVTTPYEAAQLAAMQPGQYERRGVLLARLAALRLAGFPVPDYRGLHLLAAARTARLKQQIRNFLGMLRRVWQGRVGRGMQP